MSACSTIICHKPKKLATFSAVTAVLLITSGCQSLQGTSATNKPTSPIVQVQKSSITLTSLVKSA